MSGPNLRTPSAVTDEDTVQIVISGWTFRWLREQLRARGLDYFPIPVADDDLLTFGLWQPSPAQIGSGAYRCNHCLRPLPHTDAEARACSAPGADQESQR